MEGIHELGAKIGVIHFSHVRRTGNKPAHILARQAQNLVNDVIWIEEIPCCIYSTSSYLGCIYIVMLL